MRFTRYHWAVAGIVLLALSACAPSANASVGLPRPGGESAGFLLGLWHGLTLPFMFVVSLFKDTVGVYETHNTGWPYNLGYVFGVMSAFGGAGANAKKQRSAE